MLDTTAMSKLTVMAALILAGCAPALRQSSPAGGMIGLAGVLNKQDHAARVATAECAKYSKDARVTRLDIWSNTASYECVAR